MPKVKTVPILETIFKMKGGTPSLWESLNDILHSREQEIPLFCTYIKHKINGYDKINSILALNIIDFCVDNGNISLWSELNSKDFLSSLITNLKTRDDSEIQTYILFLIEKWAKKFQEYPQLFNFKNIYIILKQNNIEFPTNFQSGYHKYVKSNYNYYHNNNDDESINEYNKDFTNNDYSKTYSSIYNNNYKSNNNNDYTKTYSNNYKSNNNSKKRETDPETYLRDINLDLNTSSYEKKYKRLVNKLYDWTHDIHEINVLINKNSEGINNNKISGLIKEISKGNEQLIETIQSGKLKDKILMNISLNVNSDIDMTLKRWNNHKKGIYPNPFISSFLQDETNTNNINNNSNYSNNNNNIKDFYNIENSKYTDNNNSNNKNCKSNNDNFNLLIDFNSYPVSNDKNNFENNNLGNTNYNIYNFFDYQDNKNAMNGKTNINTNNNNLEDDGFDNLNINQIKENNNFNYMNNINKKNNINFNNINNINFNFKDDDNESNNNSVIRQSLMYPSFDELNQD